MQFPSQLNDALSFHHCSRRQANPQRNKEAFLYDCCIHY